MTNIVDKRWKRLHIEHPLGRADKYVAEMYIRNRGKARKRRDIDICNKLHEVHRPWYQRDNSTQMEFS